MKSFCVHWLVACVAASPFSADEPATFQVTVKSIREFATKVGDLMYSIKLARGDGEEWPGMTKFARSQLPKAEETLPGLNVDKPAALRVVYQAPTGGPRQFDGKAVLFIPVTNSERFLKDTFPQMGVQVLGSEKGVAEIDLPGLPFKAYGRDSDGYYCIGLADPELVSTAKLPNPQSVVRSVKRDVELAMNPSTIPSQAFRDLFKLQPDRTAPSEQKLRTWAEIDETTLGVTIHPDEGKATGELKLTGKPGSKFASTIENSRSGPLKSAIGLSPTAWFTLSVRGAYIQELGVLEQFLYGMKGAQVRSRGAIDALAGLFESLGQGGIEDLSLSISADGTILVAAAVKDSSHFEKKIAGAIESMIEQAAKNVPDRADEIKRQSGKGVLTVAGVSISRVRTPKRNPEQPPTSIYVGVKNGVGFLAFGFSDSTTTLESTLNRSAVESSEAFSLVVKLKNLAEALKMDGFAKASNLRVESKENLGRIFLEIPIRDLAVLHKQGLDSKIAKMFGGGR